MLRIVEKSKIWFSISLIIIVIGMFFLAKNGLVLSIDFAGGTILNVKVPENFNKEEADKVVAQYAPDATTNTAKDTAANASTTGNKIILEIKSKEISGENVDKIVAGLKEKLGKDVELDSQEKMGASIGKETRNKAVWAMLIATVMMFGYIAFRFEWRFATAAIIALVHDILITIAVYAIFKIPVDSGFVAAMLTVIGYSIDDTIVVFDRIRENQKYIKRGTDTAVLANASITQTLTRSINTVVTVLITLIAVYIFVPTTRNFSKPLLIGIMAGCYSSIFIASPLWVMFKKLKKKPARA